MGKKSNYNKINRRKEFNRNSNQESNKQEADLFDSHSSERIEEKCIKCLHKIYRK